MATVGTRQTLILLAAAGSAGLMLAALAFQYIGGMAPCQMCFWQRYPHVAALGLAAVAMFVPGGARLFAGLGALALLTTSGIGFFHAGVEQGWWEGVTACAGGGDVTALSTEDLLSSILDAPLVRCDEIPWSLFGISMAGWNALISLAISGVWVQAARR